MKRYLWLSFVATVMIIHNIGVVLYNIGVGAWNGFVSLWNHFFVDE